MAALPSGTRVQLHYGAVWIKYLKRWMVAGVISDPATSAELGRINGGIMPVILSPAGEPAEVTP